MSIFDISRKRKEELLALRSKLKKTEEEKDANDDTNNNATESVKPKFRSYQPTSDTLKKQMFGSAQPVDVSETVESEVANRHLRTLENIDFSDLAPKKPDWDLKRAIEPKLRKLERRTEKAIAEIVRERLQKEASNDNQEAMDE